MKVILSRKGMDSESGVMPSPILPDGTLLSLPIPDRKSNKRYEDLEYRGQNIKEIITQLNPDFDFESYPTCHLDPDICDMFLFYGMFRETELQDKNRLSYIKGAPIRHIIYGYMEIGDIIKNDQVIGDKYKWHPHSIPPFYTNNRLYLSKKCGTFHYRDSLVLTQRGQASRSMWQLPPFFAEKGISISWQGDAHPVIKGESSVLKTASRGQEFVINADTPEQKKNLYNWVEGIIHHK